MSSADVSSPVNLGSGHPSEPVIAHIMAQPGVQRTPSPKLTLFQRRGFVTPDLCQALIALIDTQRRPSTVSDYNGDSAFRTSETCDLDAAIPIVAELERLIIDFIGLDPAHGEPIQGQRYAVGQEFKAHTDYFEPDGVDFHTFTSVAGNRTWTAMIYLNDVEEGGATWFPQAGLRVAPRRGLLLAWNNMNPDGSPNTLTLHEGMPVVKGVKYIITKWFRENDWAVY